MFDSPIHDSCPGEITVCGWPWHGRLDYAQSGGAPTLMLSNNLSITLPDYTPGVAAYEWHQHGTLLRFRDPRAGDVERTPEQLVSDAERGISWRADVLYAPRDGRVYGSRSRWAGNPRSWIYHDGSKNWRATVLNESSVQLAELRFVIGRNQQLSFTRGVQVTRPIGAPALTALTVVDALPGGSRVLLAHYRGISDIPWKSAPTFVQDELGAWCAMPYGLWELRFEHDVDGGIYSAELTAVTEPGPVRTWLTGTRTERWLDDGGELIEESIVTSTGDAAGLHVLVISYDIEARDERVIGGFYREDGSIGFYSIEFGAECRAAGNPTWQARSAANIGTGRDTAWMELRCDGVAVSRAEVHRDHQWQYVYDDISGESGSSSSHMSASIDGVTFDLPVAESSAMNGLAWFGARCSFLANSQQRGPTLSVFRYCAQMPVLAVTAKTADGQIGRQYLGNVMTPDGGARPGTSRLPPFSGLYGSWNPVTGELLRDTPNPVSYL